jgi:hypothetical protein
MKTSWNALYILYTKHFRISRKAHVFNEPAGIPVSFCSATNKRAAVFDHVARHDVWNLADIGLEQNRGFPGLILLFKLS